MPLSKDQIDRVALLARLTIEPREADQVHERLNRVLEMIEAMRAVDTTGVEPMAHALDVVQRLRADEVSEPDQRELLQALAPATDQGLYLVPRVIE